MKHILTHLLWALSLVGFAQAPTWSADVACIFYSHCTSCHHPGGVAGEHLDLMSYAEALGHRDDIAGYTAYRVMPPWPPDPAYRRFAHERRLRQEEIDIIAAWAAADAPLGDIADAPVPPTYSDAAVISEPDITAIMDEYVIPPSSTDLYRCFVLPIDNPVDTYIKRLEVIPGNREVVHHVLVYQDTSGQAQVLDAQDPQPGYTNFGGIGVDSAPLIGIWVPGSDVLSTPDGMGIKLFAGADIVVQMHYPAGSDFQSDSTRVNIELATGAFTREIAISAPLEHTFTLTNGPLIIPPNEVKTFHSQFTTFFPATITAIGPHAHLICTSMRAWAITPEQDSVPLIDIPNWDFHWQGMYEFRNPLYLPTGTVLHGEATYDNTVNNEANPDHETPQWVFLGEATTDEMMLFYFAYTLGFPADTNIVVDNAEHGPHHADCQTASAIGVEELTAPHFHIRPVPASSQLLLDIDAPACRLRIVDAQGRSLLDTPLRGGENTIVLDELPRGACVAEVRDASGLVVHRKTILLQ